MFLRTLFGRRRTNEKTQGEPAPTAEGGATLFDALWARADAAGGDSAFEALIVEMGPEQRAELVASLADETEDLSRQAWPDRRARCFRIERTLRRSLWLGIAPRGEHLQPMLTILTQAHLFSSVYSYGDARNMATALERAVQAGGFLSEEECALLRDYVAKRSAETDNDRQRGSKKHWRDVGARLEALAGAKADAGSVLLDRCESAEHPYSFQPLHPDTRFWIALLAETARALNALAAELKPKRLPTWARDKMAFGERFPAAGPVAPRFGQWDDPALVRGEHDGRGFAAFRASLKASPPAPPEIFEDAADRYENYAPISHYVWNTAALPLVDRLADFAASGGTALAEQMVGTREGTRPTAKWLKQALAAADVMGRDWAQARLLFWLQGYHTPCMTDETVIDAWNCEVVCTHARRLAERHPDWAAAVDPAMLPALGKAIALDLACGNRLDLLPSGLLTMHPSPSCKGMLGIEYLGQGPGRYDHRCSHLRRALSVSLENEEVLRAAMWLLPHMPDEAAAVDALLRSALASASMSGSVAGRYRSKTTANAAVASLKTIGTPGAMLALSRIAREVRDAAVRQAALKILTEENGPAAPQPNST